MADNSRTTPLGPALNAFAEGKNAAAIQTLGKGLPCSVTAVSGQIVTVKFEVQSTYTFPTVQMPIATSIYDWIPVQVGDKGRAVASDAYLGGISGLGGGTADLTRRGNLAMLVFEPVSNAVWTAPDGKTRIVQGPDGVVIQDIARNCIIALTKTMINITVPPGDKVAISSGGVLQAVKLADGTNSVVLEAE